MGRKANNRHAEGDKLAFADLSARLSGHRHPITFKFKSRPKSRSQNNLEVSGSWK